MSQFPSCTWSFAWGWGGSGSSLISSYLCREDPGPSQPRPKRRRWLDSEEEDDPDSPGQLDLPPTPPQICPLP